MHRRQAQQGEGRSQIGQRYRQGEGAEGHGQSQSLEAPEGAMEPPRPGQLGQHRGQRGVGQKGPRGLLASQEPGQEAVGEEAKGQDIAAKGMHREGPSAAQGKESGSMAPGGRPRGAIKAKGSREKRERSR
jgi:hypothetical protein